MIVITIIVTNALLATMLASSYVQKKRGLLLELPDWRMIPGLTVTIFLFGLCFTLLSVYIIIKERHVGSYGICIAVMSLILSVYYIARSPVLRSYLTLSVQKRVVNNNEINEDQIEDTFNEKELRTVDAIAFLEYTLLYSLKIFLMLLLFEITIVKYGVLRTDTSLDAAIIGELNSSFLSCILLCTVTAYTGLIITITRVIAVIKEVKHRPVKNSCEKIWEFLNQKEVKN